MESIEILRNKITPSITLTPYRPARTRDPPVNWGMQCIKGFAVGATAISHEIVEEDERAK